MRKKPWPRPEIGVSVRALDRILLTLQKWKEGQEEPVVGRIKEETPDPFAILVGTILSLRTRDIVTEKAFHRLWNLARTPRALADLSTEQMEEAIRTVGFYRQKAKSIRAVSEILEGDYGGQVPADLDALLALPGVGRKTANLVLTEAFGKSGICVDTHVHRILHWWGFVQTPEPEDTEQVLREILPPRWWIPINGILVTFGQRVCRPVGPRCGECPVYAPCPYPGKKNFAADGCKGGVKKKGRRKVLAANERE
jgi:endonuclease-3